MIFPKEWFSVRLSWKFTYEPDEFYGCINGSKPGMDNSRTVTPIFQWRLGNGYNNEANNDGRTSELCVDALVPLFVLDNLKHCVAENIKDAIGEMTKKLETDLSEVSKLRNHVT